MADLVPMSQAATTSLVTTLQNTDLFALAREDDTSETGYRSKVSRVDAMAKKVVNETEYSQLQTTDKKIIGAINEVNAKASKFDNMTATASGSIASFTDGGDDIPVSEYECEIVAQQASGTPTPDNPLPITGFSQADIPVCGKNFFLYSGNIDARNVTYSVVGDDLTLTATVAAGNQQQLLMYLDSKIFSGKTITFSYDSATSSYSGAVPYVYLVVNGTTVKSLTVPSQKTFTYTLPSSYTSAILLLRMYQGGAVSIDSTLTFSKCQLEISNEQTDYEPFGNLYTVAFGQTIYGGRLIYKDGQWSIEATHGYVDLGNLSWGRHTSGNFFASESLGRKPNTVSKCSIYDYIGDVNSIGDVTIDYSLAWQPANNRIIIHDSRYTSASDFQTAINGIMLVYELATPVIIPITSSTRVKTISGVNNIFSNTGDNSVKYFTENADSLAELIKAFVL